MTTIPSSRLKSYAKLAKVFGWLSLIFYSSEAVVEFLTIIVNPKFQSGIIRGDWRAWIETPTYVGGIFLKGWVYWFLFTGLSIGLVILSEISSPQCKSDNVNSPEHYQPKNVMWISKWLERMAVIGAVATVLVSIPSLLQLKETVFSLRLPSDFSWGIWLGASASLLILECGLLYFGLKGFAEVLRIMMEMEFNSRS